MNHQFHIHEISTDKSCQLPCKSVMHGGAESFSNQKCKSGVVTEDLLSRSSMCAPVLPEHWRAHTASRQPSLVAWLWLISQRSSSGSVGPLSFRLSDMAVDRKSGPSLRSLFDKFGHWIRNASTTGDILCFCGMSQFLSKLHSRLKVLVLKLWF